MSWFLCLSHVSLGDDIVKKMSKAGGSQKRGIGHIRGLSRENGFQPYANYECSSNKNTEYIYLWQEIKQNKKDNGKNHTDVLFGSLIQTERKAKMKRDDPLHNC